MINTCHNLIYKENKFIHQSQIDPKPCKHFYRQFIDKNTVVPVNIINKWSNEFDIEETEWGIIFSGFFSLSKNNKLSCFQYKLIHRILALNLYLSKCKIKETELFSFRNEAKETYKQFFWDCNVPKNIDGSNVNLTPKGIILGNIQFERNCILIFKYYLYICKLKDMLPNLNAGLQYLNSEIKMEKYYARLLSPSVVGDCFNMKWQPLEVALANVHG